MTAKPLSTVSVTLRDVIIDGISIPWIVDLSFAHTPGEVARLNLTVACVEDFDSTLPANVEINFIAIQPVEIVSISDEEEGKTKISARHGVEHILTQEDRNVISIAAIGSSHETDLLLDIINRLAGVRLSNPFSSDLEANEESR